jgi:serine protease Do
LKTIYQGPVLVLDAMTNNPGASGGVVVDLKGRAVGLLGKELKDEGAGIYLNYALPNNIVAGSVKRILSGDVIVANRNRAVQPASDPQSLAGIGVTLVPDVLTKTPAYLDQVAENSIAQRSGLLANDLVLLINNQRVDSQKSLREYLAAINKNDSFRLLVQRGQELVQIEVKP